MTEAERAILKNQIALMKAAATDGITDSCYASMLARRIAATEVILFDRMAMCSCPGRGANVHVIHTSIGGAFVCDLCDREVRRAP
jgi:hypothetical protein